MNTRILTFFLAMCLTLTATTGLAQKGYEIKVKIKSLKAGDQVLLGHHFNSQLFPDDTISLNAKGEGAFKGKEPLPGGMYIIFFPNKGRYFDIMLGDNQHFTIINDTTDFLKNAKFINSKENEVFFAYQQYMTERRQKAEELRKQKETASDKEKKKIDEDLEKLDEDIRKEMDRIFAEHPDLFFTKFLKATVDVEVPEDLPEDKRFQYYRDHYWDNFDVSDARLLRTPIYENKLMAYLERVLPPVPDSIIPRVDWLAEQACKSGSEELTRFMIASLYNHYNSSKLIIMEEVFVHIAEKYYLSNKGGNCQATWFTGKEKEKLAERVRRKKNCLIAHEAKELVMPSMPKDTMQIKHMKEALKPIREKGLQAKRDYNRLVGESPADSASLKEDMINKFITYYNELSVLYDDNVSLHNLLERPDINYVIVWFWEPSCSHCRHETPVLAEDHQKMKDEGVAIYAVFLQAFVEDWSKFTKHIDEYYDFILDHQLQDFHNVWDPTHGTQFRDLYDINSSPVSFIIDNDKQIVMKRIGPTQIKEILMDLIIDDILEEMKPGKARTKRLKQLIDRFDTKKEFEHLKKICDHKLEDKEKDEIMTYLDKLIEKAPDESSEEK